MRAKQVNDKRPRRQRRKRMTVIEDQPAPVTTDGASMHDLVIADIKDRKRIGLERYGTKLQANNGRDCLVDAYQEALDLCCYLRQAIVERDGINQLLTAVSDKVNADEL